jgi:hypothetical protein
MGGNTGSIRTLNSQSGTVGYRTYGSIIASDSLAGAGSFRRVYGWFKKHKGITNYYQDALGLTFGEYKQRKQFFLSR